MRRLCVIAVVGCSFQPGRLARDASSTEDVASSDVSTDLDAQSVDASVDAAPDATVACPGNYAENVNGSAYRYVSVVAQWLTAEQDCEDDLAGHTHLVVLDQSNELATVDAISSATFWYGSSNRINVDTWRWVTGPTAPDLGNNADRCARYSPEYNNSNDDECAANSWAYVCECDHVPAMPGTAY